MAVPLFLFCKTCMRPEARTLFFAIKPGRPLRLFCLRAAVMTPAVWSKEPPSSVKSQKFDITSGQQNPNTHISRAFLLKKGYPARLDSVLWHGCMVSSVITQSGQNHGETQDIRRRKQHKNNWLYIVIQALSPCNVKFPVFRSGSPEACHLLQCFLKWHKKKKSL